MISLIIPTFNESNTIGSLLQSLGDVLPSDSEVIVVDDSSPDKTAQVVRETSVPYTLRLIERKKRGLATAVLRGFYEAKGEVLGVMDADHSHPPSAIPGLLERLGTSDIVIGSRHSPGGRVERWPVYRKLGSLLMAVLAKPLTSVSDPLSGFFFIKKSVIQGITLSPIGYKILLEILVKGRYIIVNEVSYTFRNREVGESKLDRREVWNYLKHLSRLYRWKFMKRKVKN